MVVSDLWRLKDGSPSRRDGRGLRWRVSVEGYPSSSHRTKTEADRVNAERLLAGPPRPESSVTVGELLDVWLAGKGGLQPRSRGAVTWAASAVRGRWGQTLVADVDEYEVGAWLGNLTVGDDGRPASASLRRQYGQALAGALDVAVSRGLLPSNPARRVRLPAARRGLPRFLTPGELQRLADSAANPGAVMLLGTTGLRISEARGLDVGDVVQRRGGWRLVVRTTKGDRPGESHRRAQFSARPVGCRR